MKYGLSWDKYKKQLTMSTKWAVLFLLETFAFLGLFINGIVSAFK